MSLPGTYTEACARASEGFCPVDAGRLEPVTVGDGNTGGYCKNCHIVWRYVGEEILFHQPLSGPEYGLRTADIEKLHALAKADFARSLRNAARLADSDA